MRRYKEDFLLKAMAVRKAVDPPYRGDIHFEPLPIEIIVVGTIGRVGKNK